MSEISNLYASDDASAQRQRRKNRTPAHNASVNASARSARTGEKPGIPRNYEPEYLVVGYAPREGVLYEDYRDFPPGMRLRFLELKTGIEQGIFPPGLIVMHLRGQPCVVVGRYGDEEWRPLLEVLHARVD